MGCFGEGVASREKGMGRERTPSDVPNALKLAALPTRWVQFVSS